MRKIALTGKRGEGKFALVDNEDYNRINKYKWNLDSHGYPQRSICINGKYTTIRMHREILNFPDEDTDHKNNNPLDNRRENLRPATHSQNSANRRKSKNKSSKYKGVYFSKINKKKWKAQIKFNYQHIYLGLFENEIDAARAYDRKALELFGEYACLNFPEEL